MLSVCYGGLLTLLTGDWKTGAAMAGLLTAGVGLFLLLFPSAIEARLPLLRYYLRVVTCLSVPLAVLLLHAHTKSDWAILRSRYAASGPGPSDVLDESRRVDLVRHTRPFMVRREPFRQIGTRFDESGAYLAPSWPWSLGYKPVRVPVAAVSECREAPVGTTLSATRLRLGELGLDLDVGDDDGRVRAWCRGRGISDRAPGSPGP